MITYLTKLYTDAKEYVLDYIAAWRYWYAKNEFFATPSMVLAFLLGAVLF